MTERNVEMYLCGSVPYFVFTETVNNYENSAINAKGRETEKILK